MSAAIAEGTRMIHRVATGEEMLAISANNVQLAAERDLAQRSLELCRANFDEKLAELAAAENRIAELESQLRDARIAPLARILDEWEAT